MKGWLLRVWGAQPPLVCPRGRWSARRLPDSSQDAIWLYSGGAYTDELARQIRLAKYARHWPSVLALRARLADSPKTGLWALQPLLIPVPSDPQRLCERGFHLPVEMAKELSRITGCPMDRTGLTKADHTPEQASLGREQRLTNLTNRFVAAERLRDGLVVLVDDVLTTGASLGAARQALIRVGARVVAAVVLADARAESSMIKGSRSASHRAPKPRPRRDSGRLAIETTNNQATHHDPTAA